MTLKITFFGYNPPVPSPSTPHPTLGSNWSDLFCAESLLWTFCVSGVVGQTAVGVRLLPLASGLRAPPHCSERGECRVAG